jgi:hypothetical protein
MKRNMKATVTGTLLALLVMTLSAQQTVNITGRVTDPDGNGVAGATVRLAGQGGATSTDAQGNYALTAEVTGIRTTDGRLIQGISQRNGKIEFIVAENGAPVNIEILDVMGGTRISLVDAVLDRGSYSIDAMVPQLAGQVCFLRIGVGGQSLTFKMFNHGRGLSQVTRLDRTRVPDRSVLKKQAAVVDTIKVEKEGYSSAKQSIESYEGTYNFIIVDTYEFWGGDPGAWPEANNVMTYVFLNRTNGAYSDDEIYWSFNGQVHSFADAPTFDMSANASGRVYMHLGSPDSRYSDFSEHTIGSDVWNGNTTRVDAYVLPTAIRLICGDGTDEMLGELYQVFYMGRDNFFQAFKDAVPEEFDHCADNDYPYRIIAPGKGDGGFGEGQEYGDYFDAYLAELNISGSTTRQVFACEGNPFGSNAQLAGAVNRHVAHLPESQWDDASLFYKEAPANFYAKFFHDWSFQEKAYGFAYDDAAGYAAYTSCQDPRVLITAIGY